MIQSKPKILFRISGGNSPKTELGFGHIYRSINLATNLTRCQIFFLLEDFGSAKQILQKHGFKQIICLEKNISLNDDFDQTRIIIEKYDIDIVIVDKYGPKLKKTYLSKIKKIAKLVLVTDLDKKDFPADLIINGFIGFQNKIIFNKYNAKCLLGPKYQILNKNFSKKIKLPKKNIILATFGGFDENNINEFLMNILQKYSKQIKCKFILGPVRSSSKNKLMKKFNGCDFKIISDTKNMYSEISNVRFGFCSGGITSYEFASLGKPFAIISQVKHQLKTAKEWEKKGLAINLGMFNLKKKNQIENILKKLISDQNPIKITNRNIIDGYGSKRVSEEILNLCDKK
jgi:spore coat polysaccharide biosynthesis predicted glycosyltransferase SpsG